MANYSLFGLRIRAKIKKHYCLECNTLLEHKKNIIKVKQSEEIHEHDFDKTTITNRKDKHIYFSTVKLYCSKCDKNFEVEEVLDQTLRKKLENQHGSVNGLKRYEEKQKTRKLINFLLFMIVGNGLVIFLSFLSKDDMIVILSCLAVMDAFSIYLFLKGKA